jgi:hypothetical protein
MNDRLEIASRALQGILSNCEMVDNATDNAIKWVKEAALKYADALIALESETRKDEVITIKEQSFETAKANYIRGIFDGHAQAIEQVKKVISYLSETAYGCKTNDPLISMVKMLENITSLKPEVSHDR